MRARNPAVYALITPLLAVSTVIFGSSIFADDRIGDTKTEVVEPDVVLDEDQAQLWLERSRVCGNPDGDGCVQEFRAILRPDQLIKFDTARQNLSDEKAAADASRE